MFLEPLAHCPLPQAPAPGSAAVAAASCRSCSGPRRRGRSSTASSALMKWSRSKSCAICCHGLAGVARENAVQELLHAQQLPGLDLDVGRVAARAAARRVHVHGGVGQSDSGGPCCRPPAAPCPCWPSSRRRWWSPARDQLHRVVDGQAGVDLAAGRVDVERDLPARGPRGPGTGAARRSGWRPGR